MPDPPSDLDRQLLRLRLQREICVKASGHVHSLDVQVTEGCVLVRGSTSHAYIKQVVTQAVLDVLVEAGTGMRLDFDIRVDEH